MGYIRTLERELRAMLTDIAPETADAVVKYVKEKVYDSYQNGRAGTADLPRASQARASQASEPQVVESQA